MFTRILMGFVRSVYRTVRLEAAAGVVARLYDGVMPRFPGHGTTGPDGSSTRVPTHACHGTLPAHVGPMEFG